MSTASMVKLVDTLDSKSGSFGSVGSTPTTGTIPLFKRAVAYQADIASRFFCTCNLVLFNLLQLFGNFNYCLFIGFNLNFINYLLCISCACQNQRVFINIKYSLSFYLINYCQQGFLLFQLLTSFLSVSCKKALYVGELGKKIKIIVIASLFYKSIKLIC